MLRVLGILLFSLLAGVARAELPSGAVSELLEQAEAGHLPALSALAGGLPQIALDEDDALQAFIDSRRMTPELLAGLDPSSAALAVGMLYTRAMPDEAQAMAFYCRWMRRSFALRDESPLLDEQAIAQWQHLEATFPEIIGVLSADQQQRCTQQASAWKILR